MRGHDAAHSGTADEVVEPPLELLWKYGMGGGQGASSGMITIMKGERL